MAPRGNPPKINESIWGRPLEITSAGLFSCSLKAEPKRDSISAFENAALMFYNNVKQTVSLRSLTLRSSQGRAQTANRAGSLRGLLAVCVTKICHVKLHQAQQKNSFLTN